MNSQRIGGIVLCGGKSSRMGTSKAWLPVGGETLLARTVRVLNEVVETVVVAAAAGQALPPLPDDVRITRDEVAERGPLGGIAAALAAMDCEIVFVAACDLPNLDAASVRKIISMLDCDDAAVPVIDGEPQPLAAAYRTSIFSIVNQHLAANRLSMKDLLAAIRWRAVEGLDSSVFVNVNEPADYERIAK